MFKIHYLGMGELLFISLPTSTATNKTKPTPKQNKTKKKEQLNLSSFIYVSTLEEEEISP